MQSHEHIYQLMQLKYSCHVLEVDEKILYHGICTYILKYQSSIVWKSSIVQQFMDLISTLEKKEEKKLIILQALRGKRRTK